MHTDRRHKPLAHSTFPSCEVWFRASSVYGKSISAPAPRTMPIAPVAVKPLGGTTLGPAGTSWSPIRPSSWCKWACSEVMWAVAALLYWIVSRTREDARGGANG